MYIYTEQKEILFTDVGQRGFLKVRDNVRNLLEIAGAFEAGKAWEGISESSWFLLTCMDRLVELREIKELTPPDTCFQYKIYTNV